MKISRQIITRIAYCAFLATATSFTACNHEVAKAVPEGFSYTLQGITIERPAQTISSKLSGQVLDVAHRPIEDALIELIDLGSQTRVAARFSAASGKFVFEELPQGRFELRVSKPNFSRVLIPLSVAGHSGTAHLSIELAPAI